MRILGALACAAAMLIPGLPAVAGGPGKSGMHVDSAHKRVDFIITMGASGQASGLNFDGYADGNMTITVPFGWAVSIKAINVGGLPHSLEIAEAQAKPPSGAVPTAFPRAETIDLRSGLPLNGSDSLSFEADRAGRYWIMCGVPGHAEGGMWDWFVVSKTAKSPTIRVAQSSP